VTDSDLAAADEWPQAYRRLAGRLTHELRNPLNGAVVNLEVLRSRSAREDLAAVALRPFVEAAYTQLGLAVDLVEALLQLARATPAPVDLEATLRPLVTVLDAIAARAGGSVSLETGKESVEAGVSADVVRASFARALEPSLESGVAVRCWCERTEQEARIRFDGVSVEQPRARQFPPVASGDGSIRFPRSGAAAAR
jgi:signal transduction histidine kinase